MLIEWVALLAKVAFLSGASVFEKIGSKSIDALPFQLARSIWILVALGCAFAVSVVVWRQKDRKDNGAKWALYGALSSPVVIAYSLFAVCGAFIYLWLLKRKELAWMVMTWPATMLVTILISVVFLGETKAWGARQWIGALLVLVGMPMVLV